MKKQFLFIAFVILAVTLKAQTYNQYEVDKIKAFLAQASAIDGQNNAEALGITNLDDPGTWAGVTWQTDVTDDKSVTEISWNGNYNDPKVAGSLELNSFTALTSLYCYYNQLTSLDVTNNTALTKLNSNSNQLTSLDVSKNTTLTYLDCCSNQLTSLDVANNTALTSLDCYYNQLTSLDVTNNTALTKLNSNSNQLTSLDVSKNTTLTSLYFDSNQLTSLDVANNTALTKLVFDNNQLTSLDVSNNTALTSLYFDSNQLTSLDVANNTALTKLVFDNNLLTSLDVTKNTALTKLVCNNNQLTSLDVTNNTALTKLYCYYNNLPFSQLVNPSENNLSTYQYYSQQIIIGKKHEDKYYHTSGLAIDLSAEKNVYGTESSIVWKKSTGAEITPTTNDNWVFSFDDTFIGEEIYCEMTNSLFPDLNTLKSNRFTIIEKFQIQNLNPFITSGRSGAVSFVINDVVYVGLGHDANTAFNDFYKYSTKTDAWEQIVNFPGDARTHATAFVVNNKAYVGLGIDKDYTAYYNDFYEFDPETESWTQVADFGGTARYSAVNFVIDEFAYVGTGKDASDEQKDFWKYDAANNQWSAIAQLDGDKRKGAFAFAYQGKGYVGAGVYYDSYAYSHSDIREYDPATDTWSEKIDADGVNLAIEDAETFVLNKKAYICYGNKKQIVEYDPISNAVNNLGDVLALSRNRWNPITFVLEGEAYVGLGKTNAGLTEEYNNDILTTTIIQNLDPVIDDQEFSINENPLNNSNIGTVSANDPESAELTYTITSGNDNSAFALDATTAELTVNDSTYLDFEVQTEFVLVVEVSDGVNTDAANITVTLNDVNEAPVVEDQEFFVNENPENTSTVGTVLANDPESAELTYTITSGNDNSAFALDATTAELTVNDSTYLDFEVQTEFVLAIEVSDGVNTDAANIAVTLNDVNEAPVIEDQEFSIDENSENTTLVGTIVATDPENDVLGFVIDEGNNNDMFTLDNLTGEITVAHSEILDYETQPVYTLSIWASDGGNVSKATVTITINDLDETSIYDLQAIGIRIYPIPANENMYIEAVNTQNRFTSYIISDLSGKTLLSSDMQSVKTRIDINQLAKGTYILSLRNKNRQISTKIIVE